MFRRIFFEKIAHIELPILFLFRFLLNQRYFVISNNVSKIEATCSDFVRLKLLQPHLNLTHFTQQIAGSVFRFLRLDNYWVLIPN